MSEPKKETTPIGNNGADRPPSTKNKDLAPNESFSDYYERKIQPLIDSGRVDSRTTKLASEVVKRVWGTGRWNHQSWTGLREGD